MIYVVTKGEYSDYHIESVFDSKEKAGDFADYIDGTVEKYELNRIDDKTKRYYEEGIWFYNVVITKEGRAKIIGKSSKSNSEYGGNRLDHAYIGNCRALDNEEALFIWVLAKGEEGAIKIANEYRVQIIALNLFDKEKLKLLMEDENDFKTLRKYIDP